MSNPPRIEGGFFFTQFLTQVEPVLTCPLCKLVLRDPVEAPCRHVFCRSCLEKCLEESEQPMCPECGVLCPLPTHASPLPQAHCIIRNILTKKTIRCRYHEEGCKVEGRMMDVMEHEETCPYGCVRCPHEGCDVVLLGSKMASHTQECPHRVVSCEQCGFQSKFMSFSEHNCLRDMRSRVERDLSRMEDNKWHRLLERHRLERTTALLQKEIALLEELSTEGHVEQVKASTKTLLRRGMRVMRGPSWKWDAQDGGAGHLGTVLEDQLEPESWVSVSWDVGHFNLYRNSPDTRDLCVVIGRSPLFYTGPQKLRRGMLVIRGPTWSGGEVGGGREGVLGRVLHDQVDEHIRVEWPTTADGSLDDDTVEKYLWYTLGNMEIVPVCSEKLGFPEELYEGMFVVRGKDWKAGLIDGGEGNSGMMVKIEPHIDGGQALHIMWASKEKSVHRYDLNSNYMEVYPLVPDDRTLEKGTKVIRGRDWESDAPAPAMSSVGVVVLTQRLGDPWVLVQWSETSAYECCCFGQGSGVYEVMPLNPDFSDIHAAPEFLTMGMTVVRGKNWKWGDQDGGTGSVGVILEDQQDRSGWVHVLWDCGHRNAYRYDRSGEDAVDLMVIGHRELFASGDQPKNLDIGMRVSRGRDWKWADQDGGEGRLGTVTRTPEGEDEWYAVEWDTGHHNHYRYNEKHRDLVMVSIGYAPQPTLLKKDARVIRGRDWKYGNIGGVVSGSFGSVMEDQEEGDPNVKIRWDSGKEMTVRYGQGDPFFEVMAVWGFDPSHPARQEPGQTPVLLSGMTVVRGRDWKWGFQDGGPGKKGKVLEDQKPGDKWVKIKWEDGQTNSYRYGQASGLFDLEVLTWPDGSPIGSQGPAAQFSSSDGAVGNAIPRAGTDFPRPKKLRLGNVVVRGKSHAATGREVAQGWFGKVLADQRDGDPTVDVQWLVSGETEQCRYGPSDDDLIIVSYGASEQPKELRSGLFVARGPDWKWEDQDGGAGNIGITTEGIDSDGWVKVTWPNGHENTYRYSDEFRDVVIVGIGVTPEKEEAGDEEGAIMVAQECMFDDTNPFPHASRDVEFVSASECSLQTDGPRLVVSNASSSVGSIYWNLTFPIAGIPLLIGIVPRSNGDSEAGLDDEGSIAVKTTGTVTQHDLRSIEVPDGGVVRVVAHPASKELLISIIQYGKLLSTIPLKITFAEEFFLAVQIFRHGKVVLE